MTKKKKIKLDEVVDLVRTGQASKVEQLLKDEEISKDFVLLALLRRVPELEKEVLRLEAEKISMYEGFFLSKTGKVIKQ